MSILKLKILALTFLIFSLPMYSEEIELCVKEAIITNCDLKNTIKDQIVPQIEECGYNNKTDIIEMNRYILKISNRCDTLIQIHYIHLKNYSDAFVDEIKMASLGSVVNLNKIFIFVEQTNTMLEWIKPTNNTIKISLKKYRKFSFVCGEDITDWMWLIKMKDGKVEYIRKQDNSDNWIDG